MKRLKISLVVLALIAGSAAVVAQTDNLCNMSAEWMRTGARNAATDAADVVVYNPAALTKMKDGYHINLSNQSLFRHPEHSYDLGMGNGPQYWEQATSDPLLPNLYVAYKKNNWAMYTGMFNVGGGATMDYPTGSITTDLIGLGALTAAQGAYSSVKNPMLKATSMYLTTTLGGSYAVNGNLSFSLAARYISAKNTTKAAMTLASSPIDMPDMTMNLSTEDRASGWGGVISMNVTSVEHLDLSVRYETQVKLNFTTDQQTDDFGLTANGATHRRDLPAVFAFGASYDCSSKLKMYFDMNYYFQQNADWGKSTMLSNETSYGTLAGDAALYAAGFQYEASSKWMWSFGGGYTKMHANDPSGYFTNPGAFEIAPGDNYNVNTGFGFKVCDMVKINAGYMHTFYPEQTVKALMAQPLDVNVSVKNSIDAIALGVDLAF